MRKGEGGRETSEGGRESRERRWMLGGKESEKKAKGERERM